MSVSQAGGALIDAFGELASACYVAAFTYVSEAALSRIGIDAVLAYTAWVIFGLVRDGAEHGSVVADIVEWVRSWITWVYAEFTITLFWLRFAFVGMLGGPIHWLQSQYAIFLVLQLEVNHVCDTQRAYREGRAGIDALKGGLAHVDTGGTKKKTKKGKKGGGGGMDAGPQLVVKDLVLIGGGHAHVFVLKNFGMKPMPGVRLTLVTRDVMTPYSGMLPGHVAGIYSKEECHIDLVKLARFAKARVIHAEACGFANGMVHLKGGRPSIQYDVLSIDIGSSPKMSLGAADNTAVAAAITPVKPIDGFSARWDTIRQRVIASSEPTTVAVVGGGAGGVELALSMQARLQKDLKGAGKDPANVVVKLVTRGPRVMQQHSEKTSVIFMRILKERGVEVLTNHPVVTAEAGALICGNGVKVAYTECVWCTQAGSQKWLEETGLALDKGGFIKVDTGLQSINTPNVFASGDCASLSDPRPKAGVFAVRAGPPLTINIRKALTGETDFEAFVPQTSFLGIIGTGNVGLAVASRGTVAIEGAWLWELKDWIDRKWMAGYSHDLPQMGMEEADLSQNKVAQSAGTEALQALSHATMRCGGCGAKVGATVLSSVMKRLQDIVVTRPEVQVGLDSPDDCAVVAPSSRSTVHTVDFFRSFVDDPYIFGKIAANHALSDCHAMCAEATTALAIAVVPFSVESKVEETLYQMMAGACEMLAESNCALVGGHTCEGTELALGFCINGVVGDGGSILKGGMADGDVLVLTKPIGTGTIFAAEMRMEVPGACVAAAIESMCTSNRKAALCLREHGATACTDVTGFGLLGHLVEMTKASGVSCEVDMNAIPDLPGAKDLCARGIFSSLQPSNLRLRRAISPENQLKARDHPMYPLLFDPQTAGGLLATVPAKSAQKCIAELKKLGYGRAAAIGHVSAAQQGLGPDDQHETVRLKCK